MCLRNPLISIIMSCYKEPLSVLKESVESILLQTYKNFELILIVDDPYNSDIIEYLSRIRETDERVKVFVNPKNMGLVYSLNRAIQISSGQYIARMDADDISVGTRLYDQLKYLKSNELDFIGGYFIKITNDGNPIKEIHYPVSPKKVASYLKKRGDCVGHPTWFLKRDVYLKLRGYDDIPLCEDYHFLLKARSMNFRIGNMPKVCLYYRLSPNSISRTNLAMQTVIADFLRMNIKSCMSVKSQDIENYLANVDTVKYMKCIDDYISFSSDIKENGIMSSKNTLLGLIRNKYFYKVLYYKLMQFIGC